MTGVWHVMQLISIHPAARVMHILPARAAHVRAKGCNLDAAIATVRAVQQHVPEICQSTPTQSQWSKNQIVASRISATMEWAGTYQQLSDDDLRSIIGMVHTLVELLQ